MPRDDWNAISAPARGGDWDAISAPARPVRAAPAVPAAPPTTLSPTGKLHDGDTFQLNDGRNARLFGVDAFELDQTGRTSMGRPVPLGMFGRDALAAFAKPGATVTPTGAMTYGRPVASLNLGGDAGRSILDQGLGLVAPQYLGGRLDLLKEYMEAERLARLNRRGAHALTYQTPASARAGNPDPWAKPDWNPKEGDAKEAVFFDEPTPFQGLRPEVERGYVAIWQDLNSKPADLLAYAKANGFDIGSPAEVERNYAKRNRDQRASGTVTYGAPPPLLTDLGDEGTGAALRGFGDPINMLDEVGALADTAGLTPGRENLWSSDRRFGDVYANNLAQNRSILANDQQKYGWYRFGGQLASGVALPGASVEGVGFAAARSALRNGAGRYVAEQAAKSAVTRRLALAGGIEGGLAGGGEGETWGERAAGVAIGTPAGAVLGAGTAQLAPYIGDGAKAVGNALSRPFRRPVGAEGEAAIQSATDGALDAGKAAAQNDALGLSDLGSGGMTRTPDRITLASGDPSRVRDLINVSPSPRPAEVSAPRLGTAPLPRPGVPPRSLEDVLPEVEQWATDRGARLQGDGPYPDVMLHGSPRPDIAEFDPYGRGGYGLFGAGTYLTDTARIAAEYSKKGLSRAQQEAAADRTLYAVRHAVKNPLDMDSAGNRERWEASAAGVLGEDSGEFFGQLPPGASNEQFWREVEEYLASEGVTADEGRETMDALVRNLGHDGITHVGGGRVSKDGTRHRVVIALDPEQTEIVDRLSVGSLMRPPAPRSPDWIDVNAGRDLSRVPDRLALPESWRAPARSGQMDMAAELDRATLNGPLFVDQRSSANDWDAISIPQGPSPRASVSEDISSALPPGARDVLPLPSNTVDGVEEAARIGAGRYETVRAPNERDQLARHDLRSATDGTRMVPRRGPADLVTWVREQGGMRPEGGELQHYGITNAARKGTDFAGNEAQVGPLINRDGLSYDQLGELAHEAGFFDERPTVAEFLDALAGTHSGRNRLFRAEDMGEVEAFDAARRERWAVESARQEGAPLSVDRSEPADLADLERNQPPVEAYHEWGENAPNLAGNIRLDKLNSPQEIKRALVETARATGGFDAARRGRITQAETKSLADDLGMTVDDLLKRRKGEAFNAEQALAARQILARSGTDLVNIAKRISRVENPGDELDAAFRQAWLRHAAIQEQVAGMTAEAGRLLSQFRTVADSRDARALSSLGDMLGGPGRIKEVADRIVDLEREGVTPDKINRYSLRMLLPRWRDKGVELYINSLLSGPQTHAVNILSNTLTSLAQIPEHGVAAAVGAARKLLPGQADTDRVLFSELGSRAAGMIAGAREGMRLAARAFKTGDTPDAISKIETQQSKAIGGKLGEVIRIPTRALTAEDEFFKSVASRMELNGLALRQAAKEGLIGQAAKDRAAELALNPPDDMLARSIHYARYLTFQTPLAQDSFAAGVSRGTQRHPIFKLFLPFVRTPVNLLKFAVERSPAAPVMKSWRKEVAASGARRDLAVARAMVGSGVMAAIYEMALNGQITGGGPADKSAKRLLEADGWQPYSFKVGDTYYSYNRLDPFATTIGTVADLVDLRSHMTDKQQEMSLSLVGAAVLHNLSSKTWLSGISDALEAVNDPDRRLQGFTSRLAGSIAVPSIVAQAARTADPILREARGPMDRIRSRIPSLSSALPATRDLFGQARASEGGVGPDAITPIYTRQARNDQVAKAMLAAGVSIGRLPRKVGDRELNGAEYSQYAQVSGQAAHAALAGLIRSPEWLNATREDRKDEAARVVAAARRDARSQLFGTVPRKPRRGIFGAPLQLGAGGF